jgi:hypothetical protein
MEKTINFPAGRWTYDPICKRNATEWIRFADGAISCTFDSGTSWHPLPWRMAALSQIKRIVHRAAWPPPLDCFGWHRGQIAVAWHYQGEEDFKIGKYLALYDEKKQYWSFKFLGTLEQADHTLFHWFESVGFDTFNRVRQLDSFAS